MKNLLLFFFLLPGFRSLAQTSLCPTAGPNLIINGDFEQGYYAFTSDFGRGRNNATLGGCGTQGWILVCQINPHTSPACQNYPNMLSLFYGSPNTPTSSDPNDPSNTSVISLAICNDPLPDHTTGSGFFLTIDPDAIPGRAYWKQTVNVCAQTNYVFSVWVRNVSPGCGLPAPFFHFEVNGSPINTPVSYPDCAWVNTAATWNSGNLSGPVQIQLINDLPGCDANDVAIDDVFFGICDGAFLTCDKLYVFCGDSLGAPLALSGNSYGFSDPQFQWQKFDPTGSVWVDIPGATDSVFLLPSVTHAETGRYRFIASASGAPIAQNCAAVSETVRIVAYPSFDQTISVDICEGEVYSGYSSPGIYLDTLQTVHGCDSIRLLDLHVYDNYQDTKSLVLCPGASYNFNGKRLYSSGIYRDTLSTVFGCDSIFVLELEIPSSHFLGHDTVICSAKSFRIRSPFDQTVWFDNSTGKEKDVTQSGIYWARFTDANGCLVKDSILVEFGIEAYVPNAFSPNDDGTNDVFQPDYSAIRFDAYRFQVFDRWGGELFSTKDRDAGWDGSFRGKACDDGVYIYLIEIDTGICGKTVLSGDLSLIR